MTGTVVWFEAEKGYGFISPDGSGDDVYVHATGIPDWPHSLTNGQRVAFDLAPDRSGRRHKVKAANVRPIKVAAP